MLQKPNIPDHLIITRLIEEFGLHAAKITFLPLGYDINTAVYRAVSAEGVEYFLKLRKGPFDEMTVAVPQHLREQGVRAIIAPLESKTGRLWGSLEPYRMILYPFIHGKNGWETPPSDHQWQVFGAALRQIHTMPLPETLRSQIQVEQYSPQWREMVREFQAQVEHNPYTDPTAAKLAAFMREQRALITHVVARAEQLARAMQNRALEPALCHSDIHLGNLLIADETGPGADSGKTTAQPSAPAGLYIVDWDNPILAPKERDLMFIGAGMNGGQDESREETLFYQGYGKVPVDLTALAYYRIERIVQDIAAFCEQLLLTDEGGEDREQSYKYFTGQFGPNEVIEAALRTDEEAGKQ